MITGNRADQVGSHFNKFMLFSMTLALTVMSMVASARGSEVSISLWNNSAFEIEFDHKRYYSDCDFVITDLSPGKHRVRITQRSVNPYGGGGKMSVLYNGFIDVPRHKKVIAKIRQNRRLRVIQTLDLRPQGCHNYGCTGCSQCDSDWGDHHNDRPWGQGTIDGGSCGTGNYGTTKPTGGYYNAPAIDCMSNADVHRLINDLEQACFEEDRLLMAKRRIRHAHLESRHVRMILETLWFECSRVELAKFAFDRVADPENFYLVYDAFDFNSSINELDEFIYG